MNSAPSASLCETKKICERLETSVRDLRVLGGALLFILQRYNIGNGKKELCHPLRNNMEIKGVLKTYNYHELSTNFPLIAARSHYMINYMFNYMVITCEQNPEIAGIENI